MSEPTLADEIASCFLAAAESMLKDPVDLDQALIDAHWALLTIRKLDGGAEAIERVRDRAKAELDRRAAAALKVSP